MSLVFKVVPKENKKIEEIKNLSVNEFLEFMGDNYDFLYDDEEFLKEKVGENFLVLGAELITSRGFEFSCDKENFEVRVNTPATTTDWKTCLEFLEDLLNKTNGKLLNEDDENIKIEDIDYEKDILSGIKMLGEHIKEYEAMTLVGAGRSANISKSMIEKVLKNKDDKDKIKVFDEMVEKVFHSPAYFARQQFFKINDDLIGAYSFGCDYDIVLPLTPILSYENMGIEEEHGKISRWVLAVVLDKDTVVELDYQEAIKKIKDYKKLDDSQIEISAKTKEELKEIFEIK